MSNFMACAELAAHVHFYRFSDFDEETCQLAALCDNLKFLKYVHEKGCPWDRETTVGAAKIGSLQCLKYAHENGCPWDKDVYKYAIIEDHLECLRYAYEKKCPIGDLQPVLLAATHGSLKCLEYAFDHMGCLPVLEVCFWAAQICSKSLKCARKKGCPWDTTVTLAAAKVGNIETFRYAVENGCPFNYNECKTFVEKSVAFEILEMMVKIKPAVVQETKDEIDLTCTICLINKRSIAYVPCGHVSSCHSCAYRLNTCPHCRTPITKSLKLFFV